jgi:hypothetical protein
MDTNKIRWERIHTNRFRRARFQSFLSQLQTLSSGERPIRVLDVGGTVAYWKGVRELWGTLKLDITIVNVSAKPFSEAPFTVRRGNACDLREYSDQSFDIVHSNSVIEHVGDWAAMAAMAAEVRRLAPRYFVQTPNFWFPVEPHYRTIGFQWLPEPTRASLLTRRRFGFFGPVQSFDEAMRIVQAQRLLTRRQMVALFPDALIDFERFFGLAKSIIARR